MKAVAVLTSCDMTSPDVSRSIDAIWRIEAAQVIASLARMLRDVGLAEEFAQDALVIALEQWPRVGIPDKPGAWLLTTARHRAIAGSDWMRASLVRRSNAHRSDPGRTRPP